MLVLTNIERTFRAAVGTMRWRIKFLVLGLAVIFGACIYTRSQALLFSDYSPSQLSVEATALLIGCVLITAAYVRSGFGEIDVYPSRAVLHTSITVLLTGAYLFVVGSIGSNRRPLWRRCQFSNREPLLSSSAWPSWQCCFFLTELGKLCSSSSAATLKGRSMISVRFGRDSLKVSRLPSMRPRSPRSRRG